MKTKMLTTGAFAKLCGTQKGTLLFYDKEGLLKPKYVSANRYRRYGIEQYFEFELLSMLKDTGSSLKEIKKYLRHMDGKEFLSFLEERHVLVKKELKNLKQRKLMVQDMIMCMRESLAFDNDTLIMQHHKEEHLEIIPTKSSISESKEENVQRSIEYNAYEEKQEEKARYPFGVIASLKEIRRGNYLEIYYFNRVRNCTPQSQVHIKPEGMYAVMGHKGTIETHMQALKKMIEQIESAGIVIKSDIYIYDMMSYIIKEDGDFYAQKYCVKIIDDTI